MDTVDVHSQVKWNSSVETGSMETRHLGECSNLERQQVDRERLVKLWANTSTGKGAI